MSRTIPDREANQVRFLANMGRLAAITRFINSGVPGLEQTGFVRSKGVRADLLRAVVVFLHASIEDFVRSHLRKPNKTISFTSNSDIMLALKRIKVLPDLFTDLFPPLTQLTKRRHQIVRRADMHDTQNAGANPWDITDEWQLIHWHLAVVAFYYRVRKGTGLTGTVEDRAHRNIETALVKNIEFAHELIAFPKLPPEKLQEAVGKLEESINNILEILKMNIEMFIGPDGKPIGGVV
jgi:hypothetical protein